MSVEKLILGGAQIGFDYGIANDKGQPTIAEVQKLLEVVTNSNILAIDTAACYGDSEKIIGRVCSELPNKKRIITKLDPKIGSKIEGDESLKNAVNSSVKQSKLRLKTSIIDTLLLHRADQLYINNRIIWETLLKLKGEGVIKRLGVSVQSPEELIGALRVDSVNVIQFPYNILDSRWEHAFKTVRAIKKERDIEIHARSVFLQGLAISSEVELWKKANVQKPSDIHLWLDQQVHKFCRLNKVDLCIAYVRSMDLIDGVVIGVDSVDHLMMNLSYFDQPTLKLSQIKMINEDRPELEEKTLNPALWS